MKALCAPLILLCAACGTVPTAQPTRAEAAADCCDPGCCGGDPDCCAPACCTPVQR